MNEDFDIERFLRDVGAHEMHVFKDDGVNRHLRFSRPKTMCMHFDILTWPGYLCYTGDMGTYVFRRMEDMFEFFRRDAKHPWRIDFRYWAEKVEAQDKGDGITVYSAKKFREQVHDYLDQNEVEETTREAVFEEVLSRADDGEHEAMKAAMEFDHNGFRFVDFYERNVREYSHRFLWCCHALSWAIAKYDASKVAA